MKKEYTLTIYTENQVGLINKIAIMFSRRKISLESLNTSQVKSKTFTDLHSCYVKQRR